MSDGGTGTCRIIPHVVCTIIPTHSFSIIDRTGSTILDFSHGRRENVMESK